MLIRIGHHIIIKTLSRFTDKSGHEIRVSKIVSILVMVVLLATPARSNPFAEPDSLPVDDSLIRVTYNADTLYLPMNRLDPEHLMLRSLAYNTTRNELNVQLHIEQVPLFQYNLSTRELKIRDVSTTPRTVRNLGEDPRNGNMLLWDDSVGQVYRLEDTGPPVRIDNAFTHRNQYGHTSWIDAEGSIYAYGGYGLFAQKGYISRFDHLTGNWTVLHAPDERIMPEPQMRGVGFHDPDRKRVFMQLSSLNHTEAPRYRVTARQERSFGMWELDYETIQWSYLGDIPWTPVFNTLMQQSMHPSGSFMLIPVQNDQNIYDIVSYFPDTHTYVYLSDLGIRTHHSDGIAKVFWSPVDEAFYYFFHTWILNSDLLEIRINKLEIPDPEAFVQRYGGAAVTPADTVSSWRYAWVAFLLLVALGVTRYRKRMEARFEDPLNTEPDSGTVEATESPTGSGIISGPDSTPRAMADPGQQVTTRSPGPGQQTAVQSADVLVTIVERDEAPRWLLEGVEGRQVEVDTPNEQALLELLVRDFEANPARFTSTNTIDEVLIPEHPSPDYIRRVRNLTVSRFTTMLETAAGLRPGSEMPEMIRRRRMKSDKRKFEYRLNDTLIHIRRILSLLIVMQWVVGSANAQIPDDSLITVTYDVHTYEVPLSDSTFNARGRTFVYGPAGNALYTRFYFHGAPLHRYDMDTRELSQLYADTLRFDDFRLMEDPVTQDILLWDQGVGRVFRLTQEGELTRIDNSFHHRNQFGHAAWLSPNGDIYAFGGHGFGSHKAFITQYTHAFREWSLLPVRDEYWMPEPQSGALAIPDYTHNVVYIIGSDVLQRDAPRYIRTAARRNTGIFRLDLELLEWSFVGRLPWIPENNNGDAGYTMHPSGKFFLLSVNGHGSGQGDADIAAFFPETGSYVLFADLGINLMDAENIPGLFWSDADQAYYVVHNRWLINSYTLAVSLHRIEIPDPEAFVAKYGQQSNDVLASLVLWMGLGGMLVLGLGAVAWYRRQYRAGGTHKLTAAVAGKPEIRDVPGGNEASTAAGDMQVPQHTEVKQVLSGTARPGRPAHAESSDAGPVFQADATAIMEVSPLDESEVKYQLSLFNGGIVLVEGDFENALMRLLALNLRDHPENYVLSDDIDAALIPDHPSPDYIRRMRNITVIRLAEILQEAVEITGQTVRAPQSDDQTEPLDQFGLLLRRRNRMDRRKFEYRLNPELVVYGAHAREA